VTITTGAALPSSGDGGQPEDPAGPATSTTADEAGSGAAPHSVGRRLRAAVPFAGPGLTGVGGLALGALVVGLGTALDLLPDDSLGLAFTATFLLAAPLVALAVRTRALATAVVLPPLLFAGARVVETKAGGRTSGTREMTLDVATSLALSAPVLFAGTAIALTVVLVRLVVHVVGRR
jgi:hypothetical protein